MLGKNTGRILAVLITVTFLLPVGMLGSMNFETEAAGETGPSLDMRVMVNGYYFDPLKEEPNIPVDMKMSGPNGFFIVQMKGPILQEWREELESTGAFIHGYIPNFAYLVSMNAAEKEKVGSLSYVRWIGNYEPAYKIGVKDITGTVKLNVFLFAEQKMDGKDYILGYTNAKSEIVKSNGVNVQDRVNAVNKNTNIINKEYDVFPSGKISSMKEKMDTSRTEMYTNRLQNYLTDEGRDYMENLPMNKWSELSLWQVSAIQQMEGLGGRVVEQIDENRFTIELDSSKLSSLAFTHNILYIEQWYPKEQLMDIISLYGDSTANGYEYLDYGQALGYDGSKWAARCPLGAGKRVIGGHAEDGVKTTHQGFGGRVSVAGTNGDPDHATECMGIMFWGPTLAPGAGGLPAGYGALINYAYTDAEMADQLLNVGGVFMSHSYYTGANTGAYTTVSAGVDTVLNTAGNRRKMVFTWGAGNVPNAAGENPTQESNAKNTICVGGVEHKGTAALSDDTYSITLNGCHGPSDDGRQKPDVCGPYDAIKTLDDVSDTATLTDFGGTSGAGPTVAAAVGQIQEMYVEDFWTSGNVVPYAATVKAILIANCEQYALGTISRDAQGWGTPSMKNVIDRPHEIISDEDYSLTTGGSNSFVIASSGGTPLHITLVWTDAAGTGAVDGDTAPDIRNDLNLRVVSVASGTTYYGNMGMKTNQNTVSGTGTNPWSGGANTDANRDDLNNVENVFIASPSGNYTVYVEAYNVPSGPQYYSLVASGAAPRIGRIKADKTLYNYGDKPLITVIDKGLNSDPATVQTWTNVVHVSSTLDPTGFDVTVKETGLDTNVFTAQISLSKDEPVGVNYRQSYPTASPPVLGVNTKDTITLRYHDADPEQYITTTKPFDEVSPKISNVTVTGLKYSEFTIEFDTDEPAIGYVWMPCVDSQLTDHDLMNNMWEGFEAQPATLTEIRNGNNTFIYSEEEEYTTHHTFTFGENWDNMTYLFSVGAEDRFGNYFEDDNAGKYYSFKTPKQPFDILLVWDDLGSSEGIVTDWYGVMYAGYYPIMTVGFTGGGGMGFDWNASYPFTNYANHFDNTTLATNQQYWDAMIAASAAGVDNIVIWDTGTMCAEVAADKGVAVGFWIWDVYSISTYTVNATCRGIIQTFLDTKKGNVVFHGVGWWEDARDRAEILTFMRSYMHADKATSGGTDQGVANGLDVAAGALKGTGVDWAGGAWNDVSYAFVASTKTAGAVVMTQSFLSGMAFSSDEIDGTAYGGTNELKWGKNDLGGTPSTKWAAVSAVHATDGKTFYASAGDGWYYMTGSMTDFAWWSGFDNMTQYCKDIVKWMAPSDYVGSTGFNGTVKVGVTGLGNATVQAYAVGDRTKALGGAITDASGKYKINITAGTYDVIAFAGGYTTDNTSRTGANAVVVTKGAVATGKDFTISTAVGGIKGTVKVYDPVWKETKVSYIRVKAESASKSIVKEVWTDGGAYYIDNLPVASDYVVTAYDLVYINADYTYSGIESKSETGVTVSTGTYATKDFLLRTGRISGKVLDINYKPIENAFVYVVENDKTLEQDYKANSSSVLDGVVTDSMGCYYIPFIGDNTKGYKLRAEADGEYVFSSYNSTTDTSKYVDEMYGYFNETYSEGTPTTVYVSWGLETSSINFTLAQSTGTLKGKVYLPGGVTPASGATVTAVVQVPSAALGPSWGYWKTDSYGSVDWPGISMTRTYGWETAIYYAYTGIDGSYTIPKVVSATYNVTATKQGYGSGYKNSQVVTALGTTNVPNIVLGTIAGCSILFVDDDGGTTNDANTLAAIQANIPNTISGNTTGVSYTEWDVKAKGGYPTASYMKGFTFVIWTTGGYYTGSPHGNAEAVLMEFLNGGGSIFMTSQDWEYDHGLSTFLKDYCRLAGVTRDVYVGTTVTGVAADPISGSYVTTALPTGATPFADWADWLTPAADGIAVFKDGTTTNVNAVRYVGAYKTYYSAFPFEFVTTGAGANGYMGRIIDWVSLPPNYAPILSNGSVTPTTGISTDFFTFYVEYTDIENEAPAYVNVTVNGTQHAMSKVIVDNTYDNGVAYSYELKTGLSAGGHTFSFSASGGGANAIGDVWNHTGPTISDTTSPTIAITQGLFSVNTNEVAQVNATITDNVKIDSATLWWRFGATKAPGPWTPRDLTPSGSQLDPGEYRATIPGQSSGGIIDYYVTTTDGTNPATNNNGGSYYQISVTGGGAVPPGAPSGVSVLKVADNPVLSWGAASGTVDNYRVFRASTSNGFDFGAAPIYTTPDAGTFTWTDTATGTNSYYYIVRAYNSVNGLGPNSTMGFKLCIDLYKITAGVSNWVSIPYNTNYVYAMDVFNAIGTGNVQSISRWNRTSQSYITRTQFGGENFVLIPGEGIRIDMKAQVNNWAFMGSYNNTTAIDLYKITAGVSNWVSLPYNTKYVYAMDVFNSIGTGNVQSISYWNASQQKIITRTQFGGENFVLIPGEGIRIDMKAQVNDWDLGGVYS